MQKSKIHNFFCGINCRWNRFFGAKSRWHQLFGITSHWDQFFGTKSRGPIIGDQLSRSLMKVGIRKTTTAALEDSGGT